MPKPTNKPKELKEPVREPIVDDLPLPEVNKTLEMKQIEQREGEDIRLIIKNAIEQHGNQRAAAKHIGVHESALANWLPRLRMRVEMKPVVVIEL